MALVCYHGDNPHVINQERADVILQAVSEPERRKIIDTIKDDFKTAIQISKSTQIPLTIVYRRLHELNEKNILLTSGRINSLKKKETLYKSKVRKVVATYDNGTVDVKIFTNLRDDKI